MNLFWSTRKLTAAREDHLTEFLAAALDVSPAFRKAYAQLVLGSITAQDIPVIEDVRTQFVFPRTTCCPDMVVYLSDGRRIVCEHKLDVLETLGPESDSRSQLVRYLELPIDGLVYVRSSWNPPAQEILSHPKYIHPSNREHFLWYDFYPILSCDDHVMLSWLREGFERLGFTPPHPSVGEMCGPDENLNKKNRKNFAKLWQHTRSAAHTLGWKVTPGSIVELYLSENKSSLASWVFISPAQFDRFLLRITPKAGTLKVLLPRIVEACEELSIRAEVTEHEVRRKDGKQKVIDVRTSLREILGPKDLSSEEMEIKLHTFVAPLLNAIQK